MIWQPCNISPTAVIGDDINVGVYTEIGNNVRIGSNVRIGMGSFIPEGYTIEDNVWIGPHFCGTNDRFPPSTKDKWEKTIIRNGARLGAGVTIVCGVEVGRNALVGAGSVVTKSIPEGETWCGNPAKKLVKTFSQGDTNAKN